jgi:TolB-like protein/Tfp pilus assembly protein PilF
VSVLKELQRRHVFRVGIAYIVVAWLILQVSDVVLDNIGVPGWVFKVILLLLCVGFPLVLVFAWAYDLTPDGLKRTGQADAAIDERTAGDAMRAGAALPSKASVAVLPFVNMSGNPENDYLSDGLAEELLNALTKVSSLKVAARTSSFHFKGHTGDIAEIAATLGVGSILEGSVRQSGTRLRITTQLINARDGYHLWSETFDRELDDIFEIQDEIAKSVVKALKGKLLGKDTDKLNVGGTANPEAFKFYLQGMHYLNRGSDESALQSAIKAYEKAIELDPDYALAYAGLAETIEQLAKNNFADLDQCVSRAENAARKAVELAPELADGYLVLSNLALAYKLDKAAALEAVNQALKLDPGNVGVYINFAQIYFSMGDSEASVEAAKMAQELDPISTYSNHFLGHCLYFARKYEEAIPVFRQTLQLDPHYPRPHYGIAMCMYALGNAGAAAELVAQEPLRWMRFSGLAILERKLGHTEEAEAAMASLIESYRDNGLYQQAQVRTQWGDFDQAMACLLRARDIGDPGVSQILTDPLLDPLRGDSRFKKLAQEIGFN